MNRDRLQALLAQVRQGALSVEEACDRLRDLPFQDLGFARLDHHRDLRSGMPEVIFARGKTPDEVAELAAALEAHDGAGLVTHASPEVFARVRARVPAAAYAERARLIRWGRRDRVPARPVAVVCAGTSDLPVADEAALTADWLGHEVVRVTDAGVAGLHRILDARAIFGDAGAIVVVAGMEGALPSVVAGLVACPVVAVPTSVGYGASFEGLAALLAMLNSCSPGVAVVNIDNGFGGAVVAHRILCGVRP